LTPPEPPEARCPESEDHSIDPQTVKIVSDKDVKVTFKVDKTKKVIAVVIRGVNLPVDQD
jgi:hypothetical protein